MPSTDLFLTHDWGIDEDGRDNHLRVRTINEALKSMGYVTWFDNDRLEGNVAEQMALGIQNTKIVLTFITKRYEDKVTGNNPRDNCKLEFNYATLNKTSSKIIAIVMEKRMRNSSHWCGILGLYLGNKLFTDMSGDLSDLEYFQGSLRLLTNEIRSMGVIPRDIAAMNELKRFLDSIKLEHYLPQFEESGNEELDELCSLDEKELDDILTKDVKLKPGHKRKFVKALKERRTDMHLHPKPIASAPWEDQTDIPHSFVSIVSPVHAFTDENAGELIRDIQKLDSDRNFGHSSSEEVPTGSSNKTFKNDDNRNVWKRVPFEAMHIVLRDIAGDWRSLGQMLRIETSKLNCINVNENSIYDKASKCMELWEQSIRNPSWDILKAALEKIRRFDILDEIEILRIRKGL